MQLDELKMMAKWACEWAVAIAVRPPTMFRTPISLVYEAAMPAHTASSSLGVRIYMASSSSVCAECRGAQGASVSDCDSTVEMHSVCCEDCSAQSATDAQTAQSLRFGHNIHRHTQ